MKEPRIFRGRWFDYYHRALWHIQGGRDLEAEDDLRSALRRFDAESWDERTYGVHFTEYFPHRELGILLYRLGELDPAEKELALSLSRAESSRAKFYLNRVRRDLIRVEGNDRASPELFLDRDLDGTATAEASITISGKATDDLYVSEIRVNGEPVFIELAQPEIRFEKSVPLEPGANSIEVVAVDLAGKRAERTLRVDVDRLAPLLLIHGVEPLENAVHLIATLEDGGLLKTATIGGVDIDVGGKKVYELDRIFPITGRDAPVKYLLADRFGNELAGTIDVSSEGERQGSLLHRIHPAYSMRTGGATAGRSYDASPRFSPLVVLADSAPPEILFRDVEDGMTVMLDRFYVEGRVRAGGTLTGLRVNGRELLTRTAREVRFGETFPLSRGTNEFIVEAVDGNENHAEKSLSIERVVPTSLGLGSRLSVTILPFEYLDGAERYGTDMEIPVAQAFVSPRRFHVLDRETLDAVLLERNLSRTDLAEPSTASRVGRLLEADLVLDGYSRLYPGSGGIEIVGKMIDAGSSDVLFVHDVYTEQPDPADLSRSADGLYLKFARHFPLLSGSVTETKRGRARADLDYGMLGRPGMRFVFYREGEPLVHPVTGRVLGVKTDLLGEGDTVETDGSSAWIRIRDRGSKGTIRAGDRVIAK